MSTIIAIILTGGRIFQVATAIMPEGLAPPPTAELCPRRTANSAPRMPTIEAPYTPYRWGQVKAMAPSTGGASTKSDRRSSTPDVQGCASESRGRAHRRPCVRSVTNTSSDRPSLHHDYLPTVRSCHSGLHNRHNPCSTNFSLPTFSPEALKLY
ncbi:unnamed protein product [Clonostachys chloroleuca]|uniref:Secreted protein n=1 Tax=Clonostachys chloroleuca TaxID=1926264 RepID=A0AA35Q170_9HYPO|nr:unnamed protein product [Clonostachys chloroleuca]